MLKIGGLIAGNGIAKLSSTKKINSMLVKAEEAFGSDYCTITTKQAKEFLSGLGKTGEKAIKALPKDGSVNFLSAHGAMQLSSDGKNILQAVRKLDHPIVDVLKSVVNKIK